VAGFATNDAAERDRAVVGLTPLIGDIQRNGNCLRNFQRAGNREPLDPDACGFEHAARAFPQRFAYCVVVTRLDHEHARAANVSRYACAAPCFSHAFFLLRDASVASRYGRGQARPVYRVSMRRAA
jgi:hypothetical protein